ncbi:MAG: flavin reductase family protein [Clostridia bacterium]|nr:flavin reductase family protein [Clostridia bacterium]
MKITDIREVKESATVLFDEKWALITAGNKESFNTMTASWGGLGELWNKDVCFVFIRPQRYTYEFTEREEYFTVSFLPEEYRKALTFCGRNSGRDCNKVKEAGLTPAGFEKSMGFEESEITLLCRKLYHQDINPEGLVDKSIDSTCYSDKDYHRMYIGEIVKVFIKE